VIEQDYSLLQAAASLSATDKLLYNCVAKHKKQAQGNVLSDDERAWFTQFRKDNKPLNIEGEILK
jgi:transposase